MSTSSNAYIGSVNIQETEMSKFLVEEFILLGIA